MERLTVSVRNARDTERAERRAWFEELHELNAAIHARYPAGLAKLDREITAARKQLADNKVRFWREYYVGLHPLESLGRLVAAVRKAGSFSGGDKTADNMGKLGAK